MKMNTQLDIKYAKEIMTQSKKWTDYIKDWGCLICSIANIIQIFRGKEFTPKDLNDVVKQIKAYRYLDNPDTPESKASFLMIDKLQKYFARSFIISYVQEYKYEKSAYYIARVQLKYTGHYINVISEFDNLIWCFDVWDGEVKAYNKKEITFFYKIQKI
jgi:hypothetical protein